MPFFKALYFEEPAAAGRALLLLHGFGANSYTWRHLEPEIPDGYAPYRVDLKGFGKAEKPRDEKYSLYDQADLVLGLIEDRRLSPVSLIGHSMGAGVALLTTLRLIDAGRAPDRLILIDAVCYPSNRWRFLQNPAVNCLARVAAPLVPPSLLVGLALKLAYFDPGKVTPDMVRAYATPLRRKDARNALRSAARQLFPADLEASAARYPEITSPTLLLWGVQDDVIELESGQRLEKALPNARLVPIDRCNHIPHEERPEIAVPHMVAFLSGRCGFV